MLIPNTHFWVRPIPGNWSMAVEFLTSLLSSVSINNSLKIHVCYIIIIILLTCLRKFVTYNELVLYYTYIYKVHRYLFVSRQSKL